jgi:hypothetical protein
VLPLLEGERQLVYVFSASVPVPYVRSNLRTPTKVDQAFRAHSTINNPDGTYVVSKSIDVDGLSLTASKIGLLLVAQRKFELLNFGFVAQWVAFRDAIIYKQRFPNDDT